MADSNLPIVNAIEELKADGAKQRKSLQDSLGRRFRILSGEINNLGSVLATTFNGQNQQFVDSMSTLNGQVENLTSTLATSFNVQSDSDQTNSKLLTRLSYSLDTQSELAEQQLAFQQDQAQAAELRDAENRRELARIADGNKQQPQQQNNQKDDEKKSKGIFGKLLGGLGGIIGGAGLGAGALLAGAGILAAGGGFFLKQLNELDGKAIKENVLELLSIKDGFDGMGNFFLEGGAFGLAMFGIGAGLAAFGVGAAVGGAGNAIANFIDPNWAKSIVDNVTTLLSIGDVAANGSLALLADGAAFGLAMTGIGIGLGVFGVGAGVAGLGMALANFTDPNWAQSIVDNVTTLLSISELPTLGAFDLLATMIPLSAGLAIFGVAASVAGLGMALANFTDPQWAQSIVDNVTTLLTIAELPTLSAVDFVATMGAIATGLGVFGVGTALVGIGKFAAGDGFAQNIKDEVNTLLGILDDENVSAERADEFNTVLTRIGGALAKFGAGSFVDALGRAGAAVLDFFSGSESPITSVMKLADRKDDLKTVADSLSKISESLTNFSGLTLDADNFQIEAFADNLEDAVNDLSDVDEVAYNAFVDKMAKLREAIAPQANLTDVGAEVDVRSREVASQTSQPNVTVSAPQTTEVNQVSQSTTNQTVAPASSRRDKNPLPQGYQDPILGP